MTTIPLFKVSTNVSGALENIKGVLESGYVGQGWWCSEIERRFSEIMQRERVLYVNSGTSALQLAFHLAGAGPGTEVISTPITCLATNAAIVANGASIVWADVDPSTGNIDPESVARLMTAKTRAVVGVNWGGRVCRFDDIRKLVRGVTLIEDAAHSMCASSTDKGDITCYSLQAIKHTNSADGGLICTPSAALHERAKLLRWFGLDRSRSDAMRCYQPVSEVGWKFQGNDVLAALGVANLVGLEDRVAAHRANAEWFSRRLANVPYVTIPPSDPASSWWLYTIKVSSPARFETFMAAQGVAVSQVHARNDLYSCFNRDTLYPLSGVSAFASHQTNIPVGWWLTEKDLEIIAVAIEAWAKTPAASWSAES